MFVGGVLFCDLNSDTISDKLDQENCGRSKPSIWLTH